MKLTCTGKDYSIDILISAEDFIWAFNRGNWFITHAKDDKAKKYAVRSEKGVLIFLHKVILERHFRLPPTALHTIGDHINGDSLDNRRENLRWATCQMNAKNIFGFHSRQLELI